MNRIPFWKTETIGNDFVLVESGHVDSGSLPEFARVACARKFGVGADGLLAVGHEGPSVSLRMFNPDGSEDFCGNGLRCAALHARVEGWVGERFTILHRGRTVPASVADDGLASIVLPPADFSPGAIPLLSDEPWIERPVQGLVGTAVSAGSPHFVVLRESLPDDEEFLRVSPLVERDRLFPERVSVIHAVPEGDRRLRLRIWERSVGETLGCGTGSVAAAVVWARKAGLSGRFAVGGAGGDVLVDLERWEGPVTSATVPRRVFRGALSWPSGRAVVGASDTLAGTFLP